MLSVAVIGGGLAGLTAAFDLVNAGANVTVFEANDRWGGKIFSSTVGTQLVDAGPDNFLARVPDGIDLCVELGLEDQLTVPVSPKPAYIHVGDRLSLLPAGTVLGVPTDFVSLQGVISEAGIERAQQDLTMPTTRVDRATTVGSYCRERLGEEVTATLIDPMVGGINASSIDHLSMADAVPQLFSAASAGGSLVEALRTARKNVGATLGSAQNQPVFHGLQGGVATLIDALIHRLTTAGATLRLNNPIAELPGGFDQTIVATPAHVAARLLSSSRAGDLLASINHASVAQLTIAVPKGRITPLDASGILVPRKFGRVMTACTWFSTKWEQYASDDHELVRVTSGRFGDDRASNFTDEELQRTLLAEFAEIYSDPGVIESSRIVRWPNAFPQYEPGHGELIDSIFDALSEDSPAVHVVGNSYRGIGMPATIKLARTTATAITA